MSIINLPASLTGKPNYELKYFTWNMACHYLNFAFPDQTAVSSDGIRVNLSPFATTDDLPPWILMNLFIQICMKCIRRTISYRNPFRPLPETRPYISKWITASTNYFAVNKLIYLSKQKVVQWIGRQCILDIDSCLFCFCLGTQVFDLYGWDVNCQLH